MRSATSLGSLSPRPTLGSRAEGRRRDRQHKVLGRSPEAGGRSLRVNEQDWVLVELSIVAQVFEHLVGQGHYPIFAPFARAHPQLVLAANDVMHGEVEALR